MRTHSVKPIAVFAALLVALAACGDTPEAVSETTATTTEAPTTTADLVPLSTTVPPGIPPADYSGFRSQPTACGASQPPEAGSQQFTAPDDLALDPAIGLRITISTSCGPIIVELDPGLAPETVNSFVFLARSGYFDGTAAHRVIPGFVIQAGDPTATGLGGPGYVVPDELPPEGFAYETGVLAMANAGPNSTGSQFFIMVGDSALPPLYSAFGTVVDGFDALQSIVSVPLGPNRRGEISVPLATVYIDSVTVEETG